MRSLIFLVFSMLVLPWANLSAQDSIRTLDSRFELKTGDFAAMMIPQLLKLKSDLDATVITAYSPELKVINLELFGSRSTAEGAKETIKNYLDFLRTIGEALSGRIGVTLNDKDYRIRYYDRSWSGDVKLIIEFVNGEYKLPSE